MTFRERRATVVASVGGVKVGATHPVVVQSMTNTDTADAESTAVQVAALARAGSQIVRVTVNNDEAARAVPEIVARLHDVGIDVPIVGDFHYNGHLLLTKYPACAEALAKYRINPGQRRREATRRALPRDRGGRGRQRQAGAHRGELGLARPGSAHRDDGRQRRGRRAARRQGRLHRRHAGERPALGGARRGGGAAPRPDPASRPRCRRCKTWWRPTGALLHAATIRCTWG